MMTAGYKGYYDLIRRMKEEQKEQKEQKIEARARKNAFEAYISWQKYKDK